MDMYTEGAQTTGYHRFLQPRSTPTPCSCQGCVRHEQPHRHSGGLGFQPASARQTDHPSEDGRRDVPAPPAEDVGGGAFVADRAELGGHRSPQRRPVFSHLCPWELNPGQWSCSLESGVRHHPSVSQLCSCEAHAFNALIPHPLPHLQVKGQGYRHRRTVRYVSVDEEEEGCGCPSEPHSPHLLNGHGGPGPVFTGRDQDWGRPRGGSEEDCNGQAGSHKCFFPTEVPQTHLSQSRRKGRCIPTIDHQCRVSEAGRPSGRRESVRDRIRQVVTDLENVLGGLKQVHVEMKEVVQQIDRLTANIDVSDETSPGITPGSSGNFHSSVHSADVRVTPLANHKPADEDRIILRTNSPSPVHIASVVKTSCFTPPVHAKDTNSERPGVNGHLPHMCPPSVSGHTGQAHPEPHPQSLDPRVIIGNSTSRSKSQKPPPYPQNGRCGKGQYAPPKPLKTPANPGRGRQSTSMV